jgi:hypothetical protein
MAPPVQQVADCMRIAHGAVESLPADDKWAPRYKAVCAAIGWTTGLQESPMTARPQGEPTQVEARAEMMVADSVNTGLPLPAVVWDALGVEPRAPITTQRAWSGGVAETLGWLLGSCTRPPVGLPRRHPDGRLLSEDELYAEYLAKTARGPEERRDCRARARKDAARYRKLGDLAASV